MIILRLTDYEELCLCTKRLKKIDTIRQIIRQSTLHFHVKFYFMGRAAIPGFINYNFRDGLLPGHTKPAFNEYKILTFNIITSLL